LDFFPTFLSMAQGGTPQGPCDGVDLTALLRGEAAPQRETLYWHYPHYSDQGGTPSGAILEGDWKLIEFFEDGHLELYNLTLDPGEQYNFASSFAEKAYALREKLANWRQSVNAVMPSPNPTYNPTVAAAHEGPVGCSWQPGPGCRED
jgi:arylsulfatase A-like enzyme